MGGGGGGGEVRDFSRLNEYYLKILKLMAWLGLIFYGTVKFQNLTMLSVTLMIE